MHVDLTDKQVVCTYADFDSLSCNPNEEALTGCNNSILMFELTDFIPADSLLAFYRSY